MDQILRTLLTPNNRQWALHLSQELWDMDFQTNITDFQSHCNEWTEDSSHS